jgi:hypothetical protein
MPCQEVQAAYHKAGSDPKDISKSHFGLGLLPCNSGCKSKAQVVDQELHLRKSKDLEVLFIPTRIMQFILGNSLCLSLWFPIVTLIALQIQI